MSVRTVLVADDEESIQKLLKRVLEREGYRVVVASDGAEAVEVAAEERPSLGLFDLKMPGMDGVQALEAIRQQGLQFPVVMVTAHSTVESAVKAMKLGAHDYIKKPFDVEELKLIIQKALEFSSLEREVLRLRRDVQCKYSLDQIVGEDPKMKEILQMIQTVAATRSTALICGESGTGKELIARAIHYLSPRMDGAFVKVNCAALSENLLESELFGHEKGAFTGAIRTHQGKFEQADGGTLLLDEISEMSASVQAKLLRVLQEKEIDRVGGRDPIQVDVRVIATTNRDLEIECKEGHFREDLFYRLNVVKMAFPPLRERRGDIPLLAEHFRNLYAEDMGKPVERISAEAMDALVRYDWPGNVRQLENALERAVVFVTGDTILPAHLPPEIGGVAPESQTATAEAWVGRTIEEIEREVILSTLKRTQDNRTQAADLLGISVRTLRNKLNEYREAGVI
ncbi:MAG TPA: sigma-54 dependent transcriptional regulator [bacterium]|nr:sigma-54 dependent transcriptional regulator [bacterium]